jgi:hypothetical protein
VAGKRRNQRRRKIFVPSINQIVKGRRKMKSTNVIFVIQNTPKYHPFLII